jgi:ribosomal-protein-alanine N-acetyltransferase
MCASNADGDRFAPPVPGLELAPMHEDDLDEVLAIESEAFSTPWRREHFVFELHENRWADNRVARDGGRVVGYTSGWKLYGELKINNIAVHHDYRGRGLGGWLLRVMIDDAASSGCSVARLEVRPSNTAARRLYRNHGFVAVGRRKAYYQRDGEDALLMEAPIGPVR